ncbi:hypothetical protein CPB85DRAFT_1442024 [Mucidula mucida]|nr:hypothetical protein CPB85DRAFT_1442024 [Mucidula mucida]
MASTTGYTVQVPVDTYFATYQTDIFPSRRKTDNLISWVENELKRAKHLNKSGWADIKLKKKVKEDATCKGLEAIAKKVHDLCMAWNKKEKAKTAKVPKRTTLLVCRPNPGSEVRGGFDILRFNLMESSDGVGEVDDRTCDVGGVMEAKLGKKNRGTNDDQFVHHILYNDLCRRFVLSFTAEDNMMRFWYFSRSHIAVSAEFDYHKNPRDFIRFIIFMLFAPLERLGYDPRVRNENKRVQYRFTGGDKKSQIVRSVGEAIALDSMTRATRLWAVQELDVKDQPLGETELLKGVWLSFEAESEEDTQHAFTKDAECPLTSVADAAMADKASQLPPTGPPNRELPYPHITRTNRRIIFAEQCQTLHTVDNYGDFALGLAQLVDGLECMRLAGLVHRGISPGNCLVYMKDSERHIKISDLEYARRYDSQNQSILPFAGTPGFMAVEYQAMEHYFPPDLAAKTGKSWKDVHTTAHKPQGKKSWFQFNFLHDLESVLWILLSHLLTTVPNCLRADAPDVVEKHGAVLVLYDELFDGSLKGSMQRHNFVRDITKANMPAFTEAQEVLIAFYEEANALPLCNIMSAFVYLVSSCYQVVENTVPCVDQATPYWDPAHFKHEFYHQIHDLFMEMHRSMAGVGYHAAQELKEASDEPGPPSPPTKHESKDQVAPNPDAGPSRSRKRHADVSVDEAQKKKPKTDTGAQPSRPGKRPAKDAAKRPKRATAPAAQPLRRSTRLKSAASSGATKEPKAPARKTKQAAVKARAPSGSGSSSGQAGTSAVGTSGQPAAAGSSRQLRGERPVAGTKRVSKTAASKKS